MTIWQKTIHYIEKEAEEFNRLEELLIDGYGLIADTKKLWNGVELTKQKNEFGHRLPTWVSKGVSHKSQHLRFKEIHKIKEKKPAISSCKEKRRHIFVLFWPSTNCGLATNNETRAKSFLILGSSGSSWDLVTVRPSSTRRGGLRLEVLAELGDLGSWSHLSSGQTDQFWQDELRETFSIHTLENG